jgi:hypothetical protein
VTEPRYRYRLDIDARLRLGFQAAELQDDALWDEKKLAFISRDKVIHVEVDRHSQMGSIRVVFMARDDYVFGPTQDAIALVSEYQTQRTRFDWRRLS